MEAQGGARQVEEKRGCSSFTGCISKGARVLDACGLLIATRLDALSRVHTSWDTCWTGEWMDRRVTKIGSRIRQGAGVLREVKWCGIDSLCVCVCVCTTCVRIEIVIRAPAIKISPFNPCHPYSSSLISISIRVWYPRFPRIPWNSRFSALPNTYPAFRVD